MLILFFDIDTLHPSGSVIDDNDCPEKQIAISLSHSLSVVCSFSSIGMVIVNVSERVRGISSLH